MQRSIGCTIMSVLIIDNFDSFVHNLGRYVNQLGFSTHTVRNDAIALADIEKLSPSHIILSPGPCSPNEAGICLELIAHFFDTIPILGVCLGHQVIAQAFGATIARAQDPMHGKASAVYHNEQGVFSGLPTPLTVGRYHSLIVTKDSFPEVLVITAESKKGEIMALTHKDYPVHGVQFHPESILTTAGYDLLQAFLGERKPTALAPL
jgi:para-aminobenzoate synthetase component II